MAVVEQVRTVTYEANGEWWEMDFNRPIRIDNETPRSIFDTSVRYIQDDDIFCTISHLISDARFVYAIDLQYRIRYNTKKTKFMFLGTTYYIEKKCGIASVKLYVDKFGD